MQYAPSVRRKRNLQLRGFSPSPRLEMTSRYRVRTERLSGLPPKEHHVESLGKRPASRNANQISRRGELLYDHWAGSRTQDNECACSVRDDSPGLMPFRALNLSPQILKAVQEAGYTEPTP